MQTVNSSLERSWAHLGQQGWNRAQTLRARYKSRYSAVHLKLSRQAASTETQSNQLNGLPLQTRARGADKPDTRKISIISTGIGVTLSGCYSDLCCLSRGSFISQCLVNSPALNQPEGIWIHGRGALGAWGLSRALLHSPAAPRAQPCFNGP